MRTQIFQVDAFAARRFAGNPAAVMPMDEFPPDAMMQTIAAENNLAETAFIVPQGDDFRIRWFTPDLAPLLWSLEFYAVRRSKAMGERYPSAECIRRVL